jgi:hypothetical protein
MAAAANRLRREILPVGQNDGWVSGGGERDWSAMMALLRQGNPPASE